MVNNRIVLGSDAHVLRIVPPDEGDMQYAPGLPSATQAANPKRHSKKCQLAVLICTGGMETQWKAANQSGAPSTDDEKPRGCVRIDDRPMRYRSGYSTGLCVVVAQGQTI